MHWIVSSYESLIFNEIFSYEIMSQVTLNVSYFMLWGSIKNGPFNCLLFRLTQLKAWLENLHVNTQILLSVKWLFIPFLKPWMWLPIVFPIQVSYIQILRFK